ncbi:MAG: hypothetical protein HND47_15600 [Chloroflexi bacterium]|nr:hypothetical protein [Chloroflexota bacterium]
MAQAKSRYAVFVTILGLFFLLAGGCSKIQGVFATPTSAPTSTPTLNPTPISTPTLIPTPTPYKGIQNPDNSHWYLVLPQMDWDNAENYCASRKGHLVTIEDEEENMFVYNLAPYALLGATDRDKEGHWVWVAGQEMSYTNWCQGEPNNCGSREVYGYCISENYLNFHNDPRCLSGQWNDVSISGEESYVCEFEN